MLVLRVRLAVNTSLYARPPHPCGRRPYSEHNHPFPALLTIERRREKIVKNRLEEFHRTVPIEMQAKL